MELPKEMQACLVHNGKLALTRLARPEAKDGEILVRVQYAGVNRADLLQAQGNYPPPPGAPDIPGLEISGEVVALGQNVRRWKRGDKVCALLAGGGYAEYAVVPEALAMPVPQGVNLQEAATLPEASVTVWQTVFDQAKLLPGENFLVHGGASGIGSMAIQLAAAKGARVFTTAGTDEKCRYTESLGAAKAWNYRNEDFTQGIKDETHGKGADVVLDMTGGDNVAKNLAALAQGGRMVSIAFLRGAKTEVNLAPLLMKHLSWFGSTLRSRSPHEKARLCHDAETHIWPLIGQKHIKTIIYREFPLKKAAHALQMMEENLNLGKIVLKVGPF